MRGSLLAVLAVLMACASSSSWVPGKGSGLSQEDYEREHAICSDQARTEVPNTRQPNDAVARMHAYRNCLKDRGWVME